MDEAHDHCGMLFKPFPRQGYPPIPKPRMEWIKIKELGRGSYGKVHLAVCTNSYPSFGLIAVKSAILEHSFSLLKEAKILKRFVDCSEIVRCFGVDLSVDQRGQRFYNLLLEYASGGDLHDLMEKSGGKLQEGDVQKYTRMILKGLHCIHERGYVHCDLKPENILVFYSPNGASYVKITDFGLSKIPGDKNELITRKSVFRGTPIYMSPESVVVGEIQGGLDIWSLGCIVVEMITGNRPWEFMEDTEMKALMLQIAMETPKIPENMSEIGKDFLRRCFARDPRKRWTAEMLLRHPFLVETTEGLPFTTTGLCFSSSISGKPYSSERLLIPPPPGFESVARKPFVQKNLGPPPGFSSKSILA
jgi:serine/threonine protein kinase